MKASLVGTIFLFASTCGQHFVGKPENFLMPCVNDVECQHRSGLQSKCVRNVCVCFGDGTAKECPVNIHEVINSQGTQARAYEVKPYLGDSCNNSKQDCPANAVCNATKQCSCIDDYVGTFDKKNCLKAAQKLGDYCQDEIQCTFKFPNATCSENRKCECRKNYHEAATQCWKNVGFEEKCGDKRECWHIQGHCNETTNTCSCEGKRVINDARTMCLDVVGYKKRCLQSIQCRQDLGEAECVEGYCYCSRDHHFVETKQKCMPSKTLGQSCGDDDECYQTSRTDDRNFLICAHTKVCICTEGFERIGYQCEEINDGSSAIGLYSTTLFLVSFLLFLL